MAHELYGLFQHLGDAKVNIAREVVEYFWRDCLDAHGFGDVLDVFGIPERHFGRVERMRRAVEDGSSLHWRCELEWYCHGHGVDEALLHAGPTTPY